MARGREGRSEQTGRKPPTRRQLQADVDKMMYAVTHRENAPFIADDEPADSRAHLAELVKQFPEQGHLVRMMEETTPASIAPEKKGARRSRESPGAAHAHAQQDLDAEIREMEELSQTAPGKESTGGGAPEHLPTGDRPEAALAALLKERGQSALEPDEFSPKESPMEHLKRILAEHGQDRLEPEPPERGGDFGEPAALSPEHEAEWRNMTGANAPEAKKPERVVHTSNVDVTAERTALLDAEKTVHEKDAEFIKRSALDRAVRRIAGVKGKKAAPAVKEMNEAAAQYKKKLAERAKERIEERKEKLATIQANKAGWKAPTDSEMAPGGAWRGGPRRSAEQYAEEIARRYKRRYVHEDLVKRTERERSEASAEARAASEKGRVERGIEAAKRQLIQRNEQLEAQWARLSPNHAKTLARVKRAIIGAGFGTLGVLTLGSTIGVGGAALGASALTVRYGRAVGGALLSPVIGVAAGKKYAETRGAKRAAEYEASKTSDADTAEEIEELRKAYRAGSPEAVEHNRQLIEFFAPLIVSSSASIAAFIDMGGSIESLKEVRKHALETPPSAPKPNVADTIEPPPKPATAGPEVSSALKPEAAVPKTGEGGAVEKGGTPPATPVPEAEPQGMPMATGEGHKHAYPPEVWGLGKHGPETRLPDTLQPPPPEISHTHEVQAPPRPAQEVPATVKGPVGLSVEVKQGYGYETMVRDLAAKLKGHQLTEYPEGSDAYNLIKGMQDAKLNGAILALEKGHDFLKATGDSTLIPEGAHLTIGGDGNLHYYDAQHPDTVDAPPEAKTTLPPAPRRPSLDNAGPATAQSEHMQGALHAPGAEPPVQTHSFDEYFPHRVPPIEPPPAGPESGAHPPDVHDTVPIAHDTPAVEASNAAGVEHEFTLAGASAGAAGMAAGLTVAPAEKVPAGPTLAERQPATPAGAEVLTKNNHGVEIYKETAVYEGPGVPASVMVYGGTEQSREAAAIAWAMRHKGVRVWIQSDTKYRGRDGVERPWVYSVIRPKGFFSKVVVERPPVDAEHPPPESQLNTVIDPDKFTKLLEKPVVS